MADPTDTEVDETDDEGQAPARKNWRKELEARASEAEGRAADLERKLALSEAGLSKLSDKQVKALLAAHEGDVTGEALKATATELGFGGPKPETADPDLTEEVAEITRLAGSPPQPDTTPRGYAEVVKAANEFKGSEREYHDFLFANADTLAP